jgi:outer membrane protein OmpA-like peptidoglycan-associated protein
MQGLFLLVVGTGATLGGTMVAHFYPASGAASGSIDALPLLEQVLRKSDQGWSLLQYHAQAVPKTVGKTLGQRLGLLGSAPQGQSTGFAPLDLSDRERQQLQMELEQLQGQWQALQDQIAQLEQQLAKGDGNPGDGSPDGNQVVSELSLENRIDNLSHRLSPPISHLKQGETLRVTLPTDVLFGDGEVALQPDAALLLNNVVTDLKAHPPSHLSIATHTDNVGDADYNQALSFRRSQAVMTYLQAQSSHDHQWNILGYGESLPLVDNSTNTNRQRNRRLEITFEL